MPRISVSKRVNNSLKSAKKITQRIDELMEQLGKLIETSKSRREADLIWTIVNKHSGHMVDRQKSSIWDYNVDWNKVTWE